MGPLSNVSYPSFLDVKDYGAVGDGVADDTVAIQTAMDIAGASGQWVLFSAATSHYKITDWLYVNYSGLVIQGESWNIENNNKSRIVQTSADRGVFKYVIPDGQTSTHFITIRNLRMDGPGDAVSTAAAIDAYLDGPLGSTFSDFSTLENLVIREFRAGMRLSKFANSRINGCLLFGNYNNLEIGGNCNAVTLIGTQINTPTNVGFVSLGSGGVTMIGCEWGNGPKMVDLGQSSAQGMVLTLINNSVETVTGSPPDGSASVSFQCRSNNQLNIDRFNILAGGATTIPVFRYEQGALGMVIDARMSNFDAATELCQQYLNNSVPVFYRTRLTTYPPIGIYSDANFTTLSHTIRGSASEFNTNSGAPTPAEGRRGVPWTRYDNALGDAAFLTLRNAAGAYVDAPITPTMSNSVWYGTPEFAIGQGITLNGSSGALGGAIRWLDTNGTARRYYMRSYEYVTGDFVLLHISTGSGVNPTIPRIYHDGVNNRTSIGHTAANQPTGRATLNVEGSLGVAVNVTTGDQTLTAASASNQVYSGTGGNTWTLPAVANNSTLEFRVKNRGSGNLTIQRAGSDNIYDTTTQTSITVAAGASLMLINDGTYWLVE